MLGKSRAARCSRVAHVLQFSTPELASIALQVLEQEKRERELRREWFTKWNDSRPQGTFGTWNISDRH